MADDAASIINAAARRRQGGVEVLGVRRAPRNPHREIVVVELGVPACPQYPAGTNLFVHPRQVDAHKRRYPGAYVKRELRRTSTRAIKFDPLTPQPRGHGHRPEEFLRGARVEHRSGGG